MLGLRSAPYLLGAVFNSTPSGNEFRKSNWETANVTAYKNKDDNDC